MKYETILFDVDDTLLDFGITEKEALNKAFLKFGLPTGLVDYHDSYREISNVLWQDLEQGSITLAELGVERFRRLFLKHDININAEMFNRVYLRYLGKEVHLIEGAEEVCTALSNRRLAIITNGFKEVQISRLKASPLSDMFEYLIISEEVGYPKPEKEIFDYAFSKLQITNKDNVLIVGDSLTSDIQGGNNYGIDTCWFNPYQKENNTDIIPTYEISKLAELIHILSPRVTKTSGSTSGR